MAADLLAYGGNIRTTVDKALVLAYLPASLAHVRLLSRVDTLVHSKGGSLDELLTTSGVVADMRPNAAVDAFCSQVRDIGLLTGTKTI